MKLIKYSLSFFFIVVLSISIFSCERTPIEITERKIRGSWVEIAPCNSCDTLTFTRDGEKASTRYLKAYTQYEITYPDSLLMWDSRPFYRQFTIEFSEDDKELTIFDYTCTLFGTCENVYYQKLE